MEITIDLCKQKAKEFKLKYDGVKDEYERILDILLEKAEKGIIDYNYYLSDVKIPQEYGDTYNIVVFWEVIKILMLDGFNIVRHKELEDDMVVISLIKGYRDV